MLPTSLFKIVLKIFGLFLIMDILNLLLKVIAELVSIIALAENNIDVWQIVILVIYLAIYLVLCYITLFKTESIIKILKLDSGFNQEFFQLNFSSGWVLNVALIAVAGLVLFTEIPNLFRYSLRFYQDRQMGTLIAESDNTHLIVSAVKIVIGFLIIGERKRIIDLLVKDK